MKSVRIPRGQTGEKMYFYRKHPSSRFGFSAFEEDFFIKSASSHNFSSKKKSEKETNFAISSQHVC